MLVEQVPKLRSLLSEREVGADQVPQPFSGRFRIVRLGQSLGQLVEQPRLDDE